jgi:hypothetical protein
MKLILTVWYILLIIPGRTLSWAFGRDPLRQRRRDVATYWVERPAITDISAYFTQHSAQAARNRTRKQGMAWVALPLYRRLATMARLLAGHRPTKGFRPGDREAGVPEDIYTLW